MENCSSRRGVPLFVSRGLEVLPIMQRIKVCASFKNVNIAFFVVGFARRFSLDCYNVHGYNSLLCTRAFAYHLFMLKGQCNVRFQCFFMFLPIFYLCWKSSQFLRFGKMAVIPQNAVQITSECQVILYVMCKKILRIAASMYRRSES